LSPLGWLMIVLFGLMFAFGWLVYDRLSGEIIKLDKRLDRLEQGAEQPQ